MDSSGTSARAVVIEDDKIAMTLISELLRVGGFSVETVVDSSKALNEIRRVKPDVIISDLMMPKVDGFELLHQVRQDKEVCDTKFIMVTAKAYPPDEVRALDLGADGFIRKPVNPETFVDRLKRIINDSIDMTFWGVRGTLPKTGPDSLRYGGNTNCVTLEFAKHPMFIFDAGSGIRELGNHLLKQKRKRINAKIFISHPHWDHINALPFFTPLYMQGNEFEILGARQGELSMRELIAAQMDGTYFPVTLTEFGSRTYFRNLDEGDVEINGIQVQTKLLSHPGRALGYRVNYNGRSICYITDQELYLNDSEYFDPHYERMITEFAKDADVLITDTTYLDEDYKSKVNWGHSCVSKVVEFADNANVKKLYLYHHDPDQDDDAIDAKLEFAEKALHERGSSTECIAPKEGDCFRL